MMVEACLHDDINIFDFDLSLHNQFLDDDTINNEIAPTVTEIETAAYKAELQRQGALLCQVQERNHDIFDLQLRMERCRQEYFHESKISAECRYNALYNLPEHKRLRNAIMKEIYANRHNR